jgi:hypothetical protein
MKSWAYDISLSADDGKSRGVSLSISMMTAYLIKFQGGQTVWAPDSGDDEIGTVYHTITKTVSILPLHSAVLPKQKEVCMTLTHCAQ